MKRIFLLLSLSLWGLGAFARHAQTAPDEHADSLRQVVTELSSQLETARTAESDRKIWKNRAKYFNMGYVKQTLTGQDGGELKSDLGASISWGRTYYLHRKPLFGMLKFGLDWSWLDLNYAKYGLGDYAGNGYDDGEGPYEGEDWVDEDFPTTAHHAEIGMSFGPSVTVNPVGHLKASAYFRVTPSFSGIYIDDFGSGYATFFNVGGAISYKAISLGVETRWGQSKYKNLVEGGYDEVTDEELPSPKVKLKTKSLRFYISFRF